MTRGRWHVVAVLVGIVAVLAAVGASAEAGYGRTDGTKGTQATTTVRVGVIYSRTGLLSAYGAEYISGLKLGSSTRPTAPTGSAASGSS